MLETLSEMFKWSILLPIYTLMMMLGFIVTFFAFFKLLDFLCKDRKPKVLYSRNNPEQFWDTEYFQGYGTLIGKLKGRIVIFSNDRSQYKFVDEQDFIAANPNAYSPDNPYLVWGNDKITRDPSYVTNRSPVL